MPEDEPALEPAPRKDRLVQARVPRDLEQTLKAEARRRRLSLSQLVRNVLEDAFELVDGVVADMDQIVSDSFSLARNVSRNAQRLADPERVQDEPPDSTSGPEANAPAHDAAADTNADDARPDLSSVYGWNEVVLHRPARCAECNATIERGTTGYASLSDQPDVPRAWLCTSCMEHLREGS